MPGSGSRGASSLIAFCRDKLAQLDATARRRKLVDVARRDGMRVVLDGRELIDFSSNDVLGLSRHPRVIEAARAALEEHGTSAGASRLVTGNHPLFAKLEARVARYYGTEASL